MSDASNPQLRRRCRTLSLAVQTLGVGLIAFEAAVVGATLAAARSAQSAAPSVPLALVWLTGLALFVTNSRLVRCGTQAERIALAPRLINRPEFGVRLAFHLLINWSAIAVTLFSAAMSADAAATGRIAAVCAAATVVVWVAFNVMHRRFNRARNLLLSSVPAAALLAVALSLTLRS